MAGGSDPLTFMATSDRDIFVQTGYAFGWLPEPRVPDDPTYAQGPLGAEQPVVVPPSVDLRPGFPDPYDQGPVLSCTANAIAGLLQFERRKQALPDFTPSRMFIWWNERKAEGNEQLNAGAYLRDGVKSSDAQGFCHEGTWPYDVTKFRDAPPQAAFDEGLKYKSLDYYKLNNALLDELRTCLAAGFPFAFGFNVFSSFTQAEQQQGVVPLPTAADSRLGGHAVVAVGYDDTKQQFIIRNSWGINKGDAGYYYFPYGYLTDTNLANDFWTIRLITNAALPKT